MTRRSTEALGPEGERQPGRWFVAREREMESLRAALDRALVGDGGLTMIVGEAGIGKTALADRLVADARGRSVRVVRGDAGEGDHSPYGLWAGVRQALGLASGDDRALPTAERRWEQLEVLADGIAGAAPVLVVLEDLHWADELSLWVLERLPHELAGRPVAFVATARQDRASSPRTLPVRPTEVVPLAGLDVTELAQLIPLLGAPASVDVAAVHERTGGNPLFVREIVAAGIEAGLPPVVRDLLAHSLQRFDQPVRDTLATLALAGSDAPLSVVAAALDCPVPELRARVDEAVAGGVLVESSGGRPRFRHSLFADAALAMLPSARQRQLHQAMAVSWETNFRGREAMAQAAVHRLKAVPLEHSGAAAEAARAAARALMDSGDVPRAVSLLIAADEALAVAGPHVAQLRAEVLVDLGEARFSVGDTAAATDAFERAAGLAADLDDAELLAAAEAGAARVVEFFGVDPLRVRRLAAAEAGLPAGDHPMRVVLLGRLAVLAVGDPRAFESRYALGDEAVAMARRLGDPALLARALADCHVGPSRREDLDARAIASDELVALGERLGRPDIELLGYEWRFASRLERGDLTGGRDALDRLEGWAAVMPSPTWRYTALLRRVVLHNLAGDRQAALSFIEQATSIGRGVRPDFEVMGLEFTGRLSTARLWGQADPDLEGSHARAAGASARRPAPFIQIPIALGYVALGQAAVAQRFLEHDGLRPEVVLRGPEGLTTLSWLGALVADLGLRDRAAQILPLLEDGTGLLPLTNGLVVELPVDAIRGRLALLLGDPAAVDYLESAVALARHMPSPPLEARCLYHLGEALARFGAADAAAVVARQAAALAGQLGLVLPKAAGATEPPVTSGNGEVSLRRSGDRWLISSPHGKGVIPHSIGVAQLARLVSSPGTEVPATVLAVGDTRVAHAADLGPALDARAKRAYRARLTELQSEIEEAEASADFERASRARWELEAIMAELRRAVGLGGRDRPSGSGAERARVNVTRSLRRAVAAVSDAIPALGGHLRVSVKTGRYCSYAPEPATALRWKVSP